MDNRDQERKNRQLLGPCDYESPRVERVLTPAELEREVLYAGDTTGDADG